MVNDETQSVPWWSRLTFLVLLVLLSIVPLLWPPIPPLVDLPGHMGRYAVQLDPQSPILSQWYAFRWNLIGNVGVDLLVVPMAKLFGLELGVKLIVVAIPAMTTAALLWIAREVHGHVPPTALFALPLAYGHPFLFGFVNFTLGAALALLAFALWLRLARTDKTRYRPVTFAVLASLIWVAHTFAWGILGLLCFSAELVRQRDLGRTWVASAFAAGVACLPMALPIVPMVAWRAQATDMTGDWFDWNTKAHYIGMTLRDRWVVFDLAALAVVAFVAVMPFAERRLGYARALAIGGVVLLAIYITLPRILFGSAYADMRMTPFLFAILIVAIRPKATADRRFLTLVAVAGLCFFLVRTTATTASLGFASARWTQALSALPAIPRGSRVVAFTRWSCGVAWSTNRMEHLPALAIVRRQAFSNDQWQVSGANPMTIVKADAPSFASDPSQLVTQTPCRARAWRTIDQALRDVPRDAFDYVWLIDPPRYDVRLTAGMVPIWRDGTDVLYRIER